MEVAHCFVGYLDQLVDLILLANRANGRECRCFLELRRGVNLLLPGRRSN
jgi:hypothetical protein